MTFFVGSEHYWVLRTNAQWTAGISDRGRDSHARFSVWCGARLDDFVLSGEPRPGLSVVDPDAVDGLASVCAALDAALEDRENLSVIDVIADLIHAHTEQVHCAIHHDEYPQQPWAVPDTAIRVRLSAVQRARWTAAADAEGFGSLGEWGSDVLAGLGGAGGAHRKPLPDMRRAYRLLSSLTTELAPLCNTSEAVADAYFAAGEAYTAIALLR